MAIVHYFTYIPLNLVTCAVVIFWNLKVETFNLHMRLKILYLK